MLFAKPKITSQLLDDLNKHRAAFANGKWTQGEWGRYGAYCVIGRIAHTVHFGFGGNLLEQEHPELISALWEQLPQSYQNLCVEKYRSLMKYNDTDGRTHPEMLALYDRAIAAEKEHLNGLI